MFSITDKSGLEVIKLEYRLRLKIKPNDWLLADTCPVHKPPIIAFYFQSENDVFYNLEARVQQEKPGLGTALYLSSVFSLPS